MILAKADWNSYHPSESRDQPDESFEDFEENFDDIEESRAESEKNGEKVEEELDDSDKSEDQLEESEDLSSEVSGDQYQDSRQCYGSIQSRIWILDPVFNILDPDPA